MFVLPSGESREHYTRITLCLPRLDHEKPHEYHVKMCDTLKPDNITKQFTVPGDFSSDAQFFVFIGVIVWLYSMARSVIL